jgi:hypothetical protein
VPLLLGVLKKTSLVLLREWNGHVRSRVSSARKILRFGSLQYPSVIVDPESSYSVRKEAMNEYLCTLLSLEEKKLFHLERRKTKDKKAKRQEREEEQMDEVAANSFPERSYVGETLHIFTHIRQTLKVEWLCATVVDENVDEEDKTESEGKDQEANVRWVEEKALESAAISKGMKKCKELVDKFRRQTPKEREQQSNKARTTQRTLHSFFKR